MRARWRPGCLLVAMIIFVASFLTAVAAKKQHRFHRLANTKLEKKLLKQNFHLVHDDDLDRDRLVKDTLLINFAAQADEAGIQSFLSEHNLELVGYLSDKLVEAKVYNESELEYSLHELEDILGQDPYVEDIDVNEFHRLELTSLKSNPLAKHQWHLGSAKKHQDKTGSINIEEAWLHTQGEGIRVAVIDTGFDTGHKDINYAEGLGYNAQAEEGDEEYDATAPLSSRENHGTAVAGIIAAKDNKKGVVGVAPKAEIIPIRLITATGFVSAAQISKAFRKADEMGAQIINNSWGSYDPNLKDGQTLNLSSVEEDLYQDIAINGNNGKGILIVFSSGNSGTRNLNASPEARNPYTLSVGAIDRDDNLTSYSNYGVELDLVAPGGGNSEAIGVVTTDRRDWIIKSKSGKRRKVFTRGYSRGAYTKSFKGTSAAAPIVAGVAALVWSLDPSFTAEEVKQVLVNSANKNFNQVYSFSDTGKNLKVGYGKVDATHAVNFALESID